MQIAESCWKPTSFGFFWCRPAASCDLMTKQSPKDGLEADWLTDCATTPGSNSSLLQRIFHFMAGELGYKCADACSVGDCAQAVRGTEQAADAGGCAAGLQW